MLNSYNTPDPATEIFPIPKAALYETKTSGLKVIKVSRKTILRYMTMGVLQEALLRTIVLQCNAHDTPRIFEGQLLIRVDQDSIKNFTTQFHRDDDFLPGERAIRPDIKDEIIADLSDRFYHDLCEVIAPGQREERYRWDYLTLQLTQEELAAIKSLDEQDALQAIQDKCRIAHQFGEALKHFGYANLEPDLKLSHLVERWSQRTQGRDNVSSEWIKELQSEIYRAIDNSPANPEWKALNSANYVGSWFYPVVNHVRIVPDGSMEFDIHLSLAARGSVSAQTRMKTADTREIWEWREEVRPYAWRNRSVPI